MRVRDYDAALTAYSRASRLAPGIAGYRLKEALVLFEVCMIPLCFNLLCQCEHIGGNLSTSCFQGLPV